MSAQGVLINFSDGKNKKGVYTNKDAFEKVAKYVCRDNRDSSDLVDHIAFGFDNDDRLADQIDIAVKIQKNCNIDSRGGRRAAHMQYSITKDPLLQCGGNQNLIAAAFREMGRVIFDGGHQVIEATHMNGNVDDKMNCAIMHAHFAINSISYVDGRKFHQTKAERLEMQEKFNVILDKYQQMSPVRFKNLDTFYERNPQYLAMKELRSACVSQVETEKCR